MKLHIDVASALPEGTDYTLAPSEDAEYWKVKEVTGGWMLCQAGKDPVPFQVTVHKHRADELGAESEVKPEVVEEPEIPVEPIEVENMEFEPKQEVKKPVVKKKRAYKRKKKAKKSE